MSDVRIAIISTPRSGNSWLRSMLSFVYGATQIAKHSPDDIPWDNLPDGNCIIQIHWYMTHEMLKLLIDHGFKVITLTRHPCDVLISILQFAPREPQTAQWLIGEGGDEKKIYGVSPTSDEFIAYALSKRAGALLAVSRQWSELKGVIIVKYEDLVENTLCCLERIILQIGGVPSASISLSVQHNTLEILRSTSKNGHFWKGTPGLWKKLITANNSQKILQAHYDIFNNFGYSVDPDLSLTSLSAEANWKKLCQ